MWVKIESQEIDSCGLVAMSVIVDDKTIDIEMSGCLDAIAHGYGLSEDATYETLTKIMGEDYLTDAIVAWFVEQASYTALAMLGAPVACMPATEVVEDFTIGGNLKFLLRTYLLPIGELSSIEPVRISATRFSVSSGLIDEKIRELSRSHAERRKVEDDRCVQMGDVVEIDSVVECAGAPIPVLSRSGAMLKMKPGVMPEEFLSEVCGMRAGEEKGFSFQAPRPGGDGKLALFSGNVHVISIFELCEPEITDSWVRSTFPGIPDIQTLRQALVEAISEKQGAAHEIDSAVDEALIKRLEVLLPDEMISFAVDRAEQELKQELANHGITWEHYLAEESLTSNEKRASLRKRVIKDIQLAMALDSLYESAALTVSEEDIDETISALYPGDVASAKRELALTGQMPFIEEQTRRNKAHKWLVETAIIE